MHLGIKAHDFWLIIALRRDFRYSRTLHKRGSPLLRHTFWIEPTAICCDQVMHRVSIKNTRFQSHGAAYGVARLTCLVSCFLKVLAVAVAVYPVLDTFRGYAFFHPLTPSQCQLAHVNLYWRRYSACSRHFCGILIVCFLLSSVWP